MRLTFEERDRVAIRDSSIVKAVLWYWYLRWANLSYYTEARQWGFAFSFLCFDNAGYKLPQSDRRVAIVSIFYPSRGASLISTSGIVGVRKERGGDCVRTTHWYCILGSGRILLEIQVASDIFRAAQLEGCDGRIKDSQRSTRLAIMGSIFDQQDTWISRILIRIKVIYSRRESAEDTAESWPGFRTNHRLLKFSSISMIIVSSLSWSCSY